MGRKGVSKRKPKTKSNPSSKANRRPGESPTIASLVKDKGTLVGRGGVNPSAVSNKKNKNAR
jgi:hypothetical protein